MFIKDETAFLDFRAAECAPIRTAYRYFDVDTSSYTDDFYVLINNVDLVRYTKKQIENSVIINQFSEAEMLEIFEQQRDIIWNSVDYHFKTKVMDNTMCLKPLFINALLNECRRIQEEYMEQEVKNEAFYNWYEEELSERILLMQFIQEELEMEAR